MEDFASSFLTFYGVSFSLLSKITNFKSWHKMTLVFLYPSTFCFFEIDLRVFFYVGLSYSYGYSHKVNVLTRAILNFFSLFFFKFYLRYPFIAIFYMLFIKVYLLSSRSLWSPTHNHDHEFQMFTRVNFYFLVFFLNFIFNI